MVVAAAAITLICQSESSLVGAAEFWHGDCLAGSMPCPPPAPPLIPPTPAARAVLPRLGPQPVAVIAAGERPPPGPHVTVATARTSSARLTDAGLNVAVAFNDAAFALPLIAAFAASARPGPRRPAAASLASAGLLALAERVAASEVSVLIEGPTGTGKEGLARFVHDGSPRRDGPYVAVNCAALPDAMLEATLFGHERGAFTGATAAAPGLFRAARGGTLLLDEVAELPLALQAKLLRAVQEREVLPIGATRPEPVDVRIVACANRDLAGEVAAGRFRADLFYRLAVFPLRLTALVRRPEDIPAIAAAMLLRGAGRNIPWLTGAALARLDAHDWPGNARELGNVLDRARVLADGDRIGAADIVIDLPPGYAEAAPLNPAVRHHEDRVIRAAIADAPDRRTAASRLGISERTLRYKLAAMAGRPAVPARATLQ